MSENSAAISGKPFSVAIMQPYFIPYAGYFRLFAQTDLFVIYDCVQFPRRGWVHRNVLLDGSGTPNWLTLPLEKASQNVLIRDLRFPANAGRKLADRLRKFPIDARHPESVRSILDALYDVRGTPLDYIERLLELTVRYCGLNWRVMRSSALDIAASVRGQDRILEIARRLGARRYVNAPGGRALYDPQSFANAGIELCFLPDYNGPKTSILTRMLRDDRDELTRDIARLGVAYE